MVRIRSPLGQWIVGFAVFDLLLLIVSTVALATAGYHNPVTGIVFLFHIIPWAILQAVPPFPGEPSAVLDMIIFVCQMVFLWIVQILLFAMLANVYDVLRSTFDSASRRKPWDGE
jgi:hypothetical protein